MQHRWLALVLLLAAAQAGAAQPQATARRTDLPLTLVLSGGVSLGSYEAGLAWAVVHFARQVPDLTMDPRAGRPRLVATTGASAGSINALLSALMWCSAPESLARASVDDNLLRRTWIPTGLDQLLPDTASSYREGDGILASQPLVETLEALGRTLLSPESGHRYRPGCELPIGVTVTRTDAEERQVAGLTVRTQRFVLPWRLEVTSQGQPRFHGLSRVSGREDEEDVLRLAEQVQPGGGSALTWSQVSQGVLASAAFPAAFAPRVLCDCSARCPAAQQVDVAACPGPEGPVGPLSCPARSPRGEPLTLCRRSYVDGGIFDNAPVGLAIDLTEATLVPGVLQPATYLFVDPDVRRLSPEQERAASLGCAESACSCWKRVTKGASAPLARYSRLRVVRFQPPARSSRARSALRLVVTSSPSICSTPSVPTGGGCAARSCSGESRRTSGSTNR